MLTKIAGSRLISEQFRSHLIIYENQKKESHFQFLQHVKSGKEQQQELARGLRQLESDVKESIQSTADDIYHRIGVNEQEMLDRDGLQRQSVQELERELYHALETRISAMQAVSFPVYSEFQTVCEKTQSDLFSLLALQQTRTFQSIPY